MMNSYLQGVSLLLSFIPFTLEKPEASLKRDFRKMGDERRVIQGGQNSEIN